MPNKSSKSQKNFGKLDVSEFLDREIGTKAEYPIHFEARQIDDEKIELVCPISGEITLVRSAEGISGEFNVKTLGKLVCERCLDVFFKKIEIKFSQNYKYGAKEKEEILPIFLDRTIEIFEPIRQEILSSLPYQIVCRQDCQGLCDQCGQNLNKKKCRCKSENLKTSIENRF